MDLQGGFHHLKTSIMGIVFFDFDKTLIADNSARLYLRDLWKKRDIGFWHMLHASYWLAKYHLGFTHMEDFIKKGLALLTGEEAKEVENRTKDFYQSTIKNLYRPGALNAIEIHRN